MASQELPHKWQVFYGKHHKWGIFKQTIFDCRRVFTNISHEDPECIPIESLFLLTSRRVFWWKPMQKPLQQWVRRRLGKRPKWAPDTSNPRWTVGGLVQNGFPANVVDLHKPNAINLTFCNGLYNPFMVMLGMVYDWVYHIEVFVVNNGCIVTRTSFSLVFLYMFASSYRKLVNC